MATVLIVEDDGLVAREIAHAVRRAGHLPLLAADGVGAVRKSAAQPELVLLDLGLPDVPGEEVLTALREIPEMAQVPVLVVTGRTDDAARLQERMPPGLVGVLLKPVNDPTLTATIRTVLAAPRETSAPRATGRQPAPDALRHEVVRRIIAQGPDRLARHIYRRMCADRSPAPAADAADTLNWTQIAEWAQLEGLVAKEEAQLLCGTPPDRTRQDATDRLDQPTPARPSPEGRSTHRSRTRSTSVPRGRRPSGSEGDADDTR
jgi:DNA-binding response OmpR family regulator